MYTDQEEHIDCKDLFSSMLKIISVEDALLGGFLTSGVLLQERLNYW